MKKKIIITFIILFLIFLLVNINFFVGLFHFNKANGLYNNSFYTGALGEYIKTLDYLTGSSVNYNIGNTHYKIGELYEDIEQKTYNYVVALNIYKDILEKDKKEGKKEDEDVRYNYEFVKEKLEELQEQQQEENKQEQEKENEDQQEEKEDNSEDETENNESEDNKSTENKEENNSESEEDSNDGEKLDTGEDTNEIEGESGSEEQSLYDQYKQFELSEENMQEISDYIEKLKAEEKYNREHLNVKKEEVDPFFDSFFDRGGEKDW